MAALPAQRGGAKALLLTVLGEFVLPSGGAAWTSTLVRAASVLGINEKNARQALARLGEQGLIESQRFGRRAQWSLTDVGQTLLESGTARIYSFGRSRSEWKGEWLVVHHPVTESDRSARDRLRTELAFQGFGELSASLAISPHAERQDRLQSALTMLSFGGEPLVLLSRTRSREDDAGIVDRAWDLPALGEKYRSFIDRHSSARSDPSDEGFCAHVELVHDWRRFPFIDPELPVDLLPNDWVGTEAVEFFHRRRDELNASSRPWFAEL